MPYLLSRRADPDASGCTQRITPATAEWKYVGFEAYTLAPGKVLKLDSEDQEMCVTLLAGRADVTTRRNSWKNIGDRDNVFESKAPFAVYAPPRDEITLTALSALEIGVSRAPATGKFQDRLILPTDCTAETRGKGANTRHIRNILFDNIEAESLLVVEVVTPAGNWSSYPPHKHDTDRAPRETHLEETYYHKLNPPQGFAFQRVYTDDRELDETMTVEDGDVVMVPRGYHPVGTPYGYDLYYLNSMAGPKREWIFHNDPNHEWMLSDS